MKEIEGLTIKDRLTLFALSLDNARRSLFIRNKAQSLLEMYKVHNECQTIIAQALNPSKEMMKKVISEMPHEPFGIPNVMDTTKFDGNLSAQYPADQLKKSNARN